MCVCLHAPQRFKVDLEAGRIVRSEGRLEVRAAAAPATWQRHERRRTPRDDRARVDERAVEQQQERVRADERREHGCLVPAVRGIDDRHVVVCTGGAVADEDGERLCCVSDGHCAIVRLRARGCAFV